LAEAASPPTEPLTAEPSSFLDRRVGYVTGRWAVIAFGALGGAVVGALIGYEIYRHGDPTTAGFVIVAVAGAGFLVGGFAAGLFVFGQSLWSFVRERL
jgi:hypothetical protein